MIGHSLALRSSTRPRAGLRLLLAAFVCVNAGVVTGAVLPGNIAGAFAPATNGAATYSIAIEMADGANGLKPGIALVYNSSAGNGHAGAGWTIAGLSQIERCPLTRALDGFVRGVRLDSQDRLCLDGEPLVRLSGTHGADGAVYRRELHSFERVIARGQQGNGPAWFELQRPDGLVYRYGNDEDSRVKAPGTSAVRGWALNEIEDRFQQRIGFEYTEDAALGEHRPAAIYWTYEAGESPEQAHYRLLFNYSARPAEDIRSGYVWGSPWRSSQRLSAIEYQFRDTGTFTRVHQYSLSYQSPSATGTSRSQLASITQCGPRDCLPPTTLAWDDGVAGWDHAGSMIYQPLDHIVVGDFNGDGAADLFGNNDGYWAVWPAQPESGQSGPPVAIPAPLGADGSGLALDYNGDGFTDLLARATNTADWVAYLAPGSTSSGFTARDTGVKSAGNGIPIALDIDADGFDDVVYLRDGTAWLRRNHGRGFAQEVPAGIGNARAPYTPAQGTAGWLASADFDGDGREDLLVARSLDAAGKLVAEAYLSNGSGFDAQPIATLGGTVTDDDVIVLDMNGDGLSDVLLRDGLYWRSYISRGTASGTTSGLVAAACSDPLSAPGGDRATVVDYEGDGRADLLQPSGQGWRVYRSDGECFSPTQRYAEVIAPSSNPATSIIGTDRDGDGNTDLLVRAFGGWRFLPHQRESRADGTPAYRAGVLRELTDGLGNRLEFSYRPLSGWSGYGIVEGPAPMGSRLLPGGALVVLSQWDADAGDGSRHSVTLSYTNLRADSLGRGLLGFQSIRMVDSRGITTETSYRQDFPFIGRPERVTVWNGSDKVSMYDPSWAASSTAAPEPAADTHFVHLASDLNEAYEVDADGSLRGNLVRSTQRTLSWNFNHGAVTREQVAVSSPQEAGAVYSTVRELTLDDSLRIAYGCLGFPNRIDISRGMTGSYSEAHTTQFSYGAGHCRTVTETSGPASNPAQQLRTTYAYDTTGRLVSLTRADGAGLLAPRQTLFSYTGDATRPSEEAQVITGQPSLTTTHSWHDALGLEKSRTVPAGTTSWTFDEFGRPTGETRPAGNTQVTHSNCGPCFAPRARYSIRALRSDGYWTETQHDASGRMVGRSSALPLNRTSHQLFEYDALGRVTGESLPYRDDQADSVYWTRYRYDALGRVKSIDRPVSEQNPSGAMTTITYSGLNVTTRDAEMRATRTIHGADGRVKIVIPPLGTNTGYSYSLSGQIEAVVDPGWNSSWFVHDEQGRLVQVNHPDYGTRNFAYNAFGELVQQSDGRNPPQTMTLEYDQLGRIVRRAEPEGTTRWTYVSSVGAAQGRLQQVEGPGESGPAGFRESYAYDNLGRTRQVTTVIDDSSYQTDYAYDADGNLTSMIYPSTVGWRPKFGFRYSRGHMVRIFDETVAANRIYALTGMDASGREVAAVFGATAYVEQNFYDRATGLLSAILSGSVAQPDNLQNYEYEWDRIGNLLARRNVGANPPAEERFAYDELNRLTGTTLNGAPTLTMVYRPDGNIRTKSDVGNYIYGAEHPRAVMAIGGGPRGVLSFEYDANGNMTSRSGSPITWTSYNQPRQIGAGAYYTRLSYGPDRRRTRQDLKAGTRSKTIHYVGPHFEVETEGSVKRYRSNVFAYGRAVYSQVETSSGGLEAYYVLHDHLGSVDRLARAAGTGSETMSLSFDVWGKRRNTNWSADTIDARPNDTHWTERGFTGHEHLDLAGLVHMNGRLHDPEIGRMISPDPVVPGLGNPQGLNPYSYVINNPATFADPSGYFLSKLRKAVRRAVRHVGSTGRRVVRRWGRPIGAAIAAYYTAGAVSSWAYAAQTSSISISGPAFLTADGIAASGALGAAGTSSAIAGGVAGGAVAGAIASGDLRGIAAGALTGGAMAGIGAAAGGGYSTGRVLAEATVGGVSAEMQGGEFLNGFVTSGSLSSLTWAALEMREAMVRQSLLNTAGRNASGLSAGFRGDGFKLGGCRWPCQWGPLGGIQGQAGRFLGVDYAPGSFLDGLVETFAGPHDFLNSPVLYDELGNSANRWSGFELLNAANVLVASPFAAASVIPSYAYGAMHD